MARNQLVVRKMSKRKRGSKWGLSARKRRREDRASEINFRAYVPYISRPDYGFPDKFTTRIRYCDVTSLSATGGAIANNVYRMNSLFDPDLSAIGHQPMWADQLLGSTSTTPYNKYRVLGSKITVKFAQIDAPSTAVLNHAPCLVGIVCQQNSSLLAGSASALMETNNCNWNILQDKSGSNNVITIKNTFSPTRDLGLDAGDDTLAAASGLNPNAQFYAHVFKVDQAGSSNVLAYVEMEFLVEFFNRNEVNQS